MATFEIEEGGKKFHIDAPDEQTAMAEYQRQKASGALDAMEPLTPRNQRLKKMREETGASSSQFTGALPWQDEIMAGLAVPGNMIRRGMSGEDAGAGVLDRVGNAYSEEVQNQREMQNEAHQNAPTLSTASDIAGSLALGGPGKSLLARGPGYGAAGVQAVPNVVRPFEASFAQRAAKSAGVGGALGAAYGSGEGENLDERFAGGASGMLYGAGAGALGQGIGEGVGYLGSEVVAPLVRSARNPGQQARLTTTGAIARDVADAPQYLPERGLTEAEFNWARQQGYNVGNVDKGSENVTDLADAIYQRSPQARNRLNDFITERDNQMLPQFERVIDSMLPGNNPGDIARRQALLRAGRARVQPLYDAADAHPNAQAMWGADFDQMIQSDIMQEAMRKANKIAMDDAAINGGTNQTLNANIVRNPFREQQITRLNPKTGQLEPTGMTRLDLDPRLSALGMRPNLRYWDTVKKGLDEVIDAEKDPIKGMSPRGRRAQLLKDRLVGRLDDLTRDASGQSLYARAREAAGAYLGQDSAAEAGKKIYRLTRGNAQGGELDTVRMQVARWTPDEREIAAQSYLEALKDDMIGKARSQAGDAGSRDLSLNFLKNEKQRRVAELLLGPQRLHVLEAHNMVMRTMQYRNKGMTSNSKTWRRMVADEALGPIGGIAAGGILSGGIDPQNMSYGAMLGLLARHGPRFINNRMKTRIAPHIADEIIGNNPNTYNEVLNAIAGDDQLMNYLRLMTHPLRLAAGQYGSQ